MNIRRTLPIASLVFASFLSSACGAGFLRVMPGPLKAPYAESLAADYMTKNYGAAGDKSRTITGKVGELHARGGILSGLPENNADLIFVERKGSFTKASARKPQPNPSEEQRDEVFPYAGLVYNAATGELVTESLYAEAYRPQ